VIIDLVGDMFVTFRADFAPNPQPNPLEAGAGKSAEFRYRLQTGINLPATFALNAEILNPSVTLPPGFANTIEFRDDSNTVIASKQIEMGKNESRNITVRIPEIPTALTSASFALKVTAASGTVVGTDQRTFTVGAAVVPPDPNIEANQTSFTLFDMTQAGNPPEAPNQQTGILDGSIIKLKVGRRGVVTFNVKLTKAGTYDISILPKQGTTLNNWAQEMTPDSVGIRNANGSTVTLTVGTEGDQTPRTEKFRLTPIAGATPTGTIVFRVKRQGAPSDFFKEYGVQLLP